MKKLGVYMGRFSPLHLGHEFVIDTMLKKYFSSQSLLIIGSCNNPIEERHLFSYKDRKDFIREVYPSLDIVSLADHESDEEWLTMLEDLLCILGYDKTDTEFFAGCKRDVYKLIDAGYKCTIVNRYDGTTPLISATQVREALYHYRPLDNLVNPKLWNLLRSEYEVRLAEHRNKINDITNYEYLEHETRGV